MSMLPILQPVFLCITGLAGVAYAYFHLGRNSELQKRDPVLVSSLVRESQRQADEAIKHLAAHRHPSSLQSLLGGECCPLI